MKLSEAVQQDPHKLVNSEWFKAAVEAMAATEKIHPRATLDSLLLSACAKIPLELQSTEIDQ